MRPPGCPVTDGQFDALELSALGYSNTEIAEMLGTTRGAIASLHAASFKSLGVTNIRDALRVLRDGGWMNIYEDLSPQAINFIRAFDAYLLAPPHQRNQMLVRDLCNLALDDLLSS